eukprot:TRINITY_DN24653_c0_g1_i1.p1 TRINITY_DN24653_c0_g1~~TRINITY_DN24653_c0_g1_i1.p1  ORF type:complete len:777 (+),score=298.86 TRINITY_DN24653_c0_g1_i1:130-2460(+)
MGNPTHDAFASDEEQLQMLKQLAAALEKSIPTASVPMQPFLNVPRHLSPTRDVTAKTSTKIDLRATTAAAPPRASAASTDTQMPDGGAKGFGEIFEPQETIYERLYSLSKKAPGGTRKPPPEGAKPVKRRTAWDAQVNENRRDLYLDAEARRRAQQERVAKEAAEAAELRNQCKVAPATAALARQRKIKDLQEVFARHATPAAAAAGVPAAVRDLGKMSYVGMSAALIDLGVITDRGTPDDERMADRAWTAMYEEQPPTASNAVYIHFPEFSAVLLKMLAAPSVATASRSRSSRSSRAARRPPTPTAARPASSAASSRTATPASAPADDPAADGGGLCLGSAARQHVVARQLSSPAATARRASPAGQYACTFNPVLNENSKKMTRSRSGTPRYLAIGTNELTREQRLEEVRQDVLANEMKECTFRPDVNLKAATKYASSARQRRSLSESRRAGSVDRRKTEERQEEQTLKECTFEPKVNPYKRVKDQPLPNGYFESIKRLREGKYDHKSFADKLRDGGAAAEPAAAAAAERRSSSVGGLTQPKPFKFSVSAKNARKPLMYLDIQLPKGRKGRVGIHEGDTAEALARAFANSYHLPKQMEAKLAKVLAHHIDTVVPELLAKRTAQQRQKAESARVIQGAFAESAAAIQHLAAPPPRASAAPTLPQGDGDDDVADDSDEAPPAPGVHNPREAEGAWGEVEREYAAAVVGDALRVAPEVVAPPPPPAPADGDDEILRLMNAQEAIEPQGGGGGDLSLDGIEALFTEIQRMEEEYGLGAP